MFIQIINTIKFYKEVLKHKIIFLKYAVRTIIFTKIINEALPLEELSL